MKTTMEDTATLTVTEKQALILSQAIRKVPVTEDVYILMAQIDHVYKVLRVWPEDA